MTEDDLPAYVERPGVQTFAPPILARGTVMQSFALQANHDRLQALVDKYLNAFAPAQTDYTFRAVGDVVFLAYAPMAHISVTDPIDGGRGFMRETDTAFWMPVAAGRKRLGVWVPEKLAWFLPYVWVDVPTAMTTGREVYGFPKEMSWLETPKSEADPLVFGLSAMVLPTYSPETELVTRPLLRAERKSETEAGSAQVFGDLEQMWKEFVRLLQGGRQGLSIPSLGLDVDLAAHFALGELPMIFLKEFRDAEQPHRACYARIIGALSKVVGFRIAYPLLASYEITIQAYQSHPIAADFGFPTQPDGSAKLASLFGFYVDFDFELELGSVYLPR
jgi:hypothetical protein